MHGSMVEWRRLHEIARNVSTDSAWNRLDEHTIKCCSQNASNRQDFISLIEAGIARLGGTGGVTIEDGPVSETWMEHLLQSLRRFALDQAVTMNSQTNQESAIHSIEPDGRLVAVNESWCCLSGYRPEDVIGRPWTDLLGPESRHKAIHHNLPVFWSVGVIRTEYDMILKNGQLAPIDLAATSEIGANGTPTRSITVIRKK